MHRHANGPCLVRDGTGDRLSDPPGRVGREFITLGVVKFFHRLDQSEIALLDQIEKIHTLADVFFCNGNDKAQVRLDQLVLRGFIALSDPFGKIELSVGIEQRNLTDVF